MPPATAEKVGKERRRQAGRGYLGPITLALIGLEPSMFPRTTPTPPSRGTTPKSLLPPRL